MMKKILVISLIIVYGLSFGQVKTETISIVPLSESNVVQFDLKGYPSSIEYSQLRAIISGRSQEGDQLAIHCLNILDDFFSKKNILKKDFYNDEATRKLFNDAFDLSLENCIRTGHIKIVNKILKSEPYIIHITGQEENAVIDAYYLSDNKTLISGGTYRHFVNEKRKKK